MKILFRLNLLVLVFVLSSCDVLNQLSQIQSFSKCEFRLKSVDNIKLAGVKLDNKNTWKDLGFMNIASITSALTRSDFPLEMNINVQVKNPNARQASLNNVDWILILDGVEMTRGTLNKRISVPANGGVGSMPVGIRINLKEVLKNSSGDALIRFGKNLLGMDANPSKITMKVKPRMDVLGVQVEYPGYITLSQSFKAK